MTSNMSFHEMNNTQNSMDLTGAATQRPREVEAALARYEAPKTRLAARLPARPTDGGPPLATKKGGAIKDPKNPDPATEEPDGSDSEDDATLNVPDRKMVKIKSKNTLKHEQKRMARMKPSLEA
mmetsp:Transcript_8028/g.15489  ORF Transcript_8028/g.15489 Transcript_8028/m.15489 type:complete len:124 (+) Transcript_8028:433-804(+)